MYRYRSLILLSPVISREVGVIFLAANSQQERGKNKPYLRQTYLDDQILLPICQWNAITSSKKYAEQHIAIEWLNENILIRPYTFIKGLVMLHKCDTVIQSTDLHLMKMWKIMYFTVHRQA